MQKEACFQGLVPLVLHSHSQYGPLYVWEITGIILGIIGLLKQEEQKYWAIIGIIVCTIRLIATLTINGAL